MYVLTLAAPHTLLIALLFLRLPQLGFTTTYIIGTFALPTFIFLFYAAIKKGQAEVEEDDAKYDGPW